MKHFLFYLPFVLLSLMSCQSMAQTGYKNAPISQLTKLKSEKKALVIDVRTPAEWQEGVIEGASLFIDFKSATFQQQIATLDKSKTYIVYCRSGGRSAGASQVMFDNGFKNVINMEGGIMSWGGKIVKKP
ncbi:MAG: rhodanese-like domain-containing protein [Flavobacteriales bacterium]